MEGYCTIVKVKFLFFRRCSGCRKKRSLRTNSFFEHYPKVSLGNLMMLIYLWSTDLSRKQTVSMMKVSNNLVCRVFRRLEEVCSVDIGRNPVIPFGGRCLVKCDESKFNHKAKVSISIVC